ncbi:hypothetical protein N7492_005865 [Penicillium capsulatum]|uniref:Bud22 domain-containing protein n=1 Tax=Penicillium capsulatum TaxID=69766 RepID=A0A9W9IE56_9EURO|nr:hypothetical protein N7492_005865 [Penicillium capsulatum]KAJ6135033.1 hypothetical protein N7512_000193 [Penicillium capsulatum]
MPKRKHSELQAPARSDTRKLSIKAVRLATKFDQGVQLISRGLKTARGFERQKLSRREKTAKEQTNSTTSARITEEINALKALDYQVTAERYLFKQLSKTKRIAESPAFKEFAELKNVSTEAPKGPAEANVLARLFKSNPVKNVVPNTLAEIRKLLGVDDVPAAKQGNPDNKKDAPSKDKKEKSKSRKIEESESASEDNAPQKRARDMSISEGEGSESEDFDRFAARLGPGSISEVSEPESESQAEDMRAVKGQAPAADDISDSFSRSPSPTFSADSPPPKKSKASKASAAPAQNTTFLPSLMMGGYWSGSEEVTDDEAETGPPKRKNRMGQQARRALWEKKYGGKANHIQQEQKQQKRNRDSGWDTKRGATGSGPSGRGRGRGRGGGFGHPRGEVHLGPHPGPGPSMGGNPRGSLHTGPLHPSWEAKRREKEQNSSVAFQGKKITFD